MIKSTFSILFLIRKSRLGKSGESPISTLHLENGRTVTIEAEGNNNRNIYVDSMQLNGKEYGHNFITHEALTKGARIEVQMTPKPNLARGTTDEDAPYSFTKERRTGK